MNLVGLTLLGILILFDLVLLYACFKNEKEIEKKDCSPLTRNDPPDASDDSNGRE